MVNAELLFEPCEPVRTAVERLQEKLGDARLAPDTDGNLRIVLDRRPSFRGGSTHNGDAPCQGNQQLIEQLRNAHRLLERFSMSPFEVDVHQEAQAPRYQRDRRMMHLGLIAPRLQRELMLGRGATALDQLADASALPLAWADQLALEPGDSTHDKNAKMP